MQFRPMEEKDLEEICKLDRDIFRSMAYSERDFRHAMEGKFDRTLVLQEDTKILAYGILRILGVEAELESIAVRETERGKGYGKRMLSIFLNMAEEAGAGKVFLEVREGNAAGKALYEGMGFRAFGKRTAYYRDPVEDAILMERTIG